MTLGPLHLLLVLGAPLVLGAGLLRRLGVRFTDDRLAFAGWSWLCGALATALLTLVWLAAHKPIDGRWLAPLAAVLGSVLLVAPGDRAPRATAGAAPRESWLLCIALALSAASFVDVALAGDAEPVLFGDEANIWTAKAKTLFTSDGLGIEFALHTTLYVYHYDYPILNPLLQVWTYAAADGVVHVENRLPIQLFALALLCICSSALLRHLRPAAAALGLLWIGTHEYFAQTHRYFTESLGRAEADLGLACLLFASVDAWQRWTNGRDPAHWRLFACLLAATVWMKNEGLMLAVVLAIALGVAQIVSRRRPGSCPQWPDSSAGWSWLGAPALVVAFHVWSNWHFGFDNDLFALSPTEATHGTSFWQRLTTLPAERLGPILRFFGLDIAGNPAASQLILPALALALAAAGRRTLHRAELLVPVLCVVGGLCAYVTIFVITPHDLAWHLQTAAARTVFHVTPLALLALAGVAAASHPGLRPGAVAAAAAAPRDPPGRVTPASR